jgi:hypothetical protein
MILCAERFDREQHLASLPGLGNLSASASPLDVHLPSGDWAERQTHLRGFDKGTLSANRLGRRLLGRAETTTSQRR